jgi:homoserine O-succinyltransferase
MAIIIPENLPAYTTLTDENVFVIAQSRAKEQDIRPLRVAILNIMPDKIQTETQLLRLLSNTPLQVEITLVRPATHESKNTSASHLESFYTTFDAIKQDYFDALIITGAPVETLEFEQVNYWAELCAIMDWSRRQVFSTLHICWGAQAGLYYHYGIHKYPLPSKMFGVFAHAVLDKSCLMLKGFDDVFDVPHSRHTQIKEKDLRKAGLKILARSDIAGAHLITSKDERQFFLLGHAEYDRETLGNEYFRDVQKGLNIELPYHYFPDNDPTHTPENTWTAHASLMYANWLNFCVYQRTPYDLTGLLPVEL